ncbi:hypothetical protein [Flammeovirga sp. EKP202]|uniref:hypothetical protein n=1 Tax=Flammeovirga sp. EKP202 TaxID=2770592 RepID=UPI00165FE162|nr:hypothetical protein [Flammeovirga sp. EKP202]MBD0401958.1 hypothetical protein [Flammeovirga sp. EKP202]
MNKLKITFWTIFLTSILLMIGCERTSFMESSGLPQNITVRNLSYPSIINARAYSKITTAVPTMDSDGVPCAFSIQSVRSEEDGELPSDYLDQVSIASAYMDSIRVILTIDEYEEQKKDESGALVFDGEGEPVMLTKYDTTFHYTPLMNPNKAGQITIEDGNKFGEGDYYFTMALTPITDTEENTQIFEDAFHLNVMPLLPIGIRFESLQQNLVIGQELKTLAPTLKFAKEVPSYDVRFELLSDTLKLQINSVTGEISLNPSYNITKNEAVTPSVRVISNITGEVVDFEGSIEILQIIISDEPLVLNAGPLLPPAMMYIPYAQNLVEGAGTITTAPDVSSGNPSLTFTLESETDKLMIDERTGQISLNPAYVLSQDQVEVTPTVKVTSLISYEEKTFEAKVKVVISKTVVFLPKSTFNFFYPSLIGMDGFKVQGVNRGGVGDALFWKNNQYQIPSQADAERPAGITKPHGIIIHNLLYGPTRSPLHDSWMIMDAQNLVQYNADGYDVKAVFWMKNDLVLYLPDGSAPADLEVYITDNYTGNVSTTTWTQVNSRLKYKIEGVGVDYTGTPYPGDNTGDNPDGGKNNDSALAYKKWLRFELDLADYKAYSKFTLAFRYKTNYEETFIENVKWGACSGRFVISNVNYKADEI